MAEPGDDDLTELRRLHEAATPGPWAWEMTGDKDNSWGVGIIVDDDENLITGRNEPGENLLVESVCEAGADGNPADAELIVAMRNALPGLLAEVERLRAAAPASEDDEPECLRCGRGKADHILIEGDNVPESRCLVDAIDDVLHDMETSDPPAETEWVDVIRAVHATYRERG
jgi:hypothetical protein